MISYPSNIKPTPWDSIVFGVDTFEISEPKIESFVFAGNNPGHYTVKIDPLLSKKDLHLNGFYYCDTLIEPWSCQKDCNTFVNSDATLVREPAFDKLLEICDGAFSHGRFHRDFNLPLTSADQRYNNWLRQLNTSGKVYGLAFKDELVGFVAVQDDRLILHALSKQVQGLGLAKYFWSLICNEVFLAGHDQVSSSISATNLPVLNLYVRLGFRFRQPIDIYHRLTT